MMGSVGSAFVAAGVFGRPHGRIGGQVVAVSKTTELMPVFFETASDGTLSLETRMSALRHLYPSHPIHPIELAR
jgi:hypothetical protein